MQGAREGRAIWRRGAHLVAIKEWIGKCGCGGGGDGGGGGGGGGSGDVPKLIFYGNYICFSFNFF